MTCDAGSPVVVGVDGSACGLEAVKVAASEATLHHRPLQIVHAALRPAAGAAFPPGVPGPSSAAYSGQARAFLAEARHLAGQIAPGAPATTELIDGTPPAGLLQRSRPAALLVLGDSGLGAFISLFTGATAVPATAHGSLPLPAATHEVAGRPACPVLVVRGGPHRGGPIVVGVDGSPGSTPALEFAAREAALRGSELVALHAWTEKSGIGPDDARSTRQEACSSEDEASAMLTEAVADVAQRYPGLRIRRHAERGSAQHLLAEWSHSAQLIVLGDRDFVGLLLGSIGQHLIHCAACPTAVVPGAE